MLLNLDRDTSGDSPKTLVQAALSRSSAQIGPVLASVDRIGLKFALDFPEDQAKANLHFANLDVGFLAPAGIGLAVDARSVKGGGFLFYDAAKQQYAGVMELELSGVIALKAIGLLSTRLPDGSQGYSLLILVTAQTAQPGGVAAGAADGLAPDRHGRADRHPPHRGRGRGARRTEEPHARIDPVPEGPGQERAHHHRRAGARVPGP